MLRKPRSDLSLERLRSLLDYNPETGVFFWKERGHGRPIGRPAGCKNNRGYLLIQIDEVIWLAHRLAWFHHFGKWPGPCLDHKNGNPSDNRIANLRKADRSQNSCNRRGKRNSRSGVKGVCWCKQTLKWRAQVTYRGKDHTLGRFASQEGAKNAYQQAAKALHGEFARF